MNKLLIFVLYMLTQPFVELFNLIKSVFEKGAALNYPKTWQYVFAILALVSYLAKNRFLTIIFGVMLFVTIIKTEWDRGLFIEKYRKRLEERAIKIQEDKKVKKIQESDDTQKKDDDIVMEAKNE